MSIETDEDVDLWIKFAKYAIIGNRVAHPDETSEQVAERAFDDATAMFEVMQKRI